MRGPAQARRGVVRRDAAAETLGAASEAARGSDVFLSVGTSSLVYPAAALPFEALEIGATVVEINPGETPLSPHADYALRGQAGDVLPRLIRELSK